MIRPRPLSSAGMPEQACLAAYTLLEQATGALNGIPHCAWWVPGRIEILGKHTDYAGGQVLNLATDVGMVVAARPRDDALVRIHSAGRTLELTLGGSTRNQQGWGTYAASVVSRLSRHFPGLERGAGIAIAANLPAAAGMSSSSAFIIALHLALAHINDLAQRSEYRSAIRCQEDLVQYLGCHENGLRFRGLAGDAGVGTSGGSQDHAAILLSQSGKVNHWSFAPFQRLGSLPWPSELRLAVVVSGVKAEKTAAAQVAYNRVAMRARLAVHAWNAASGHDHPHLGAVLAHHDSEHLLAAIADTDLRQRAEQFIIESSELIPQAMTALQHHDHAGFGRVVARSQVLAESHLQNQVPQTTALVTLAVKHGALAASSFGAGFGGAVWAAFSSTNDAAQQWFDAYVQSWPQQASSAMLQRIQPGPGVTAIPLE